MTYQETITQDRRLSLLLVLAETPGYRANGFLLRDAIQSIYGHSASIDQVKTDLAWLHEQGLVGVHATGDVTMATLSTRGQDVATGRAEVPGVRKPSA
jgi:hypothetical protein